MNILESKITKVTVFNDRAQVTRVAQTDTTKGEHIFRFENLPESIEEKSIQVNGLGKVLLKEIKLATSNYINSIGGVFNNYDSKRKRI